MEYSILVGGMAGQGVETCAAIITDILHSYGFYIYSAKDYMSRVRGGHNFVNVRFSDQPLLGPSFSYDLILSLDANTYQLHHKLLRKSGFFIHSKEINQDLENAFYLDPADIARRLGSAKVYNTVLIGAFCRFFTLPAEAGRVLEKYFKGSALELNHQSFLEGYESVQSRYDLSSYLGEKVGLLVNGNEAFAAGAVAGGLTFYAAYPMTPATSIMSFLSSVQHQAGLLVEQAEDEIAAVNMAIGASYAGARAMTGSSGGGFALMCEGIGLAAVAETPLVIAEVQRPGPATGLSTRTEQGDLFFTLFAGQGEYPRMLIALTDHTDAFAQGVRSLDIAMRYQIPVIVLSDQYLADSVRTVAPFAMDSISLKDSQLKEFEQGYRRYAILPDGVSPMLIPGSIPGMTAFADSHEHNEKGEIVEDEPTRIAMVQKRARKEEVLLAQEVREPALFGTASNLALLGFGSCQGAIQEAQQILEKEGISCCALIWSDLWPFPTQKVQALHAQGATLVNVEQNFTGQLRMLLAMQTGLTCRQSILKYDGRAISAQEIVSRIKEMKQHGEL